MIHKIMVKTGQIAYHTETRNVFITKYARLYKLSNGIMVMTQK